MSRVLENAAFPSEMEVKLRRIRWRQVGLSALRASAAAVSTLIVTMLVAMLVDWWFTLFDTAVRTALTVTSLSVATAILLKRGIGPVIQALGWTKAASDADARVPQLEERWTTVSCLAQSKQRPATPAAKAMLAQVTSEAVALGTLVEPARVARAAELKKGFLLAGGCTSLLLCFLTLNWRQNSILLCRFWMPTAPITATQLASITGDASVPRGEPIELVANISGLPRTTATLHLVTEGGTTAARVLEVETGEPGLLTHRVDVDQSFRYRLRAGDGQTDWHTITAIDPPELAAVRLTVTAPEYVDRAPYEKTLLPGRVKAIQGSRLTLEMQPAAAVQRFELLLETDSASEETTSGTVVLECDSTGWYRFETRLEQDLALTPILYSPFGLTNTDRRTCRFRVIPDKAPLARVISPTSEMSVSPDETIEIKFEAHDDHGIAKAELVVYRERADGEQEEMSVQQIPLGDQQLAKHILAETELDLSGFELDEGSNISYAVRVTDNRMMKLDPRKAAAPQQPDDNSRRPVREGQTPPDSVVRVAQPQTPSADAGDPPPDGAETELDHSADPSASRVAASQPAQLKNRPDKGDESTTGSQRSETDLAAATTREANGNDPASESEPESESESESAVAERGPRDQRLADPPAASPVAKSPQGEPTRQRQPVAPATVASAAATTAKPSFPGDEAAESATNPPTEGPAAQDSEPRLEVNSDAAEATGTPAAGQNGEPSAASPGSTNSPASAAKQAGNRAGDESPPDEPSNQADRPADGEAEQGSLEQPGRQTASIELSEAVAGDSATSTTPTLDLDRDFQFEAQLGQNTLSNRMRLRIRDRIAVATEAGESRRSDAMNTRELLAKIDTQLAAAESGLIQLNRQPTAAALTAAMPRIDPRLEEAELMIAALRKNSKGTKYEFVGLQLLDIGRTHVTPARDRTFVLIQDPGADPDRNVLRALHHTSSARELLAALTKQFEEVARERELADALQEVAEIYEVYVDNMQNILREAQQNRHPLERKMAVVEVDEAYLERYAEIMEMRRQIMAEFGRILSDDPRLMGKYMDLIKRRGNNMRNQLTDLREQQELLAYEVSGWLRVDESQRPDVWVQVAEMRLLAAREMVKGASQLESRTLTQLPLELETNAGASGAVVQHAREVALLARQSSVKARELMAGAWEEAAATTRLVSIADELVHALGEFAAELERLSFEHQEDEETDDFIDRRLAESRAVAEQAVAWAEVASHVRHARYHGLAGVDQQRLAVETDRLRIAMGNIEDDLEGLFAPGGVPAEVTNIVRQLLMAVENITFNQAAATYELNNERLAQAEAQQSMANEGFALAEELFDKMRRTVASILDEREVDDPDIADLEDPTLDEFLERLEREPNLAQLLGIPNRPSNLRVLRDWMLWQDEGRGQEGSAAEQAAANARQRAKLMAQRQRGGDEQPKDQQPKQSSGDRNLTEEEMQRFAKAEQLEDEIEQLRQAIEEQLEDPALSDQRREELQKHAAMLARLAEEAEGGKLSQRKWQEMAEADEVQAMLKALAKGEPIPDSQWNRLLSKLNAGLWQVRGRTPPEDYRRPIEQYQDLIQQLLSE